MEVEEDKTLGTEEDDARGGEAEVTCVGVEVVTSMSMTPVGKDVSLRHRLP